MRQASSSWIAGQTSLLFHWPGLASQGLARIFDPGQPRRQCHQNVLLYQNMTLSCKKLYRLAVIKLDSYSKCRVKLYYRESIKMSSCTACTCMYQDMNWKLYRLAVIQLGSHNNCTEESSCIAASQSKCLAVPEHELETVLSLVNQNIFLYKNISWKLYRLAVIQLDSYNNWKSQAVLLLVNLDIAESLRLFVFNNERFALWSRSLVSSTSLRKNIPFLSLSRLVWFVHYVLHLLYYDVRFIHCVL